MRYFLLMISLWISACGGGSLSTAQYSFLDYSLFDNNAKGLIVSPTGEHISNWETKILDVARSKITWTGNEEYFYWDDQWIYLDRYYNIGSQQTYIQYVTKQEFCQNNVCMIITNEGKQKYAPRYPKDNYTINTNGYILTVSGERIDFSHTQDVIVGINCSNPYYSTRVCLVQKEKWWDNNLSEFSLKYNRDTYYAVGLGAGFIINDYGPIPYTAYLK